MVAFRSNALCRIVAATHVEFVMLQCAEVCYWSPMEIWTYVLIGCGERSMQLWFEYYFMYCSPAHRFEENLLHMMLLNNTALFCRSLLNR